MPVYNELSTAEICSVLKKKAEEIETIGIEEPNSEVIQQISTFSNSSNSTSKQRKAVIGYNVIDLKNINCVKSINDDPNFWIEYFFPGHMFFKWTEEFNSAQKLQRLNCKLKY